MRGKKLTVAQCNMLKKNGIDNPRDYLHIKTVKNGDIDTMIISDKATGQTREVILNKEE